MSTSDPKFETRLAVTEADLRAAQRLRYEVFVDELGGDGPLVDHEERLERDEFDPFYDHLILIDSSKDSEKGEHVVGVYRLLRGEKAADVGQFYSESEYDLSALKSSGRKLLELGRSCVHKDYRGGTAMFHLWNGLASYVLDHNIEILFGVASFHGTNLEELRQPLAYLHANHLAPPELRVRVLEDHFQSMDLVNVAEIDRRAAMINTPALIKAYLRLGGFVGEGAYIDHAFNTTDVCLLMDTEKMNAKHKSFYTKNRAT
ncbi:GNAT family N-acetyltransferase [Falsihalocynthiibacter arcticus]|uniref:L-ornithine N(alpha)-acyltransferase n=1 Tax=Falsihalocynthiibacter arcticus TaxID=1579316 RepID=A0A126V397_9RHOB|nr:GNAT family N-acyltransferase [Falsihalocynthiibacter arcticus]AML52792.1 ornithine-acyl-ACP acyltransferase [Falsihalocynthiibacter arcticus]